MIYFFSMAMVLAYYLIFIVYYQSLFPVHSHRVPHILLTLAFVFTSYECLNAWNLLLLNFPAVTAIMIGGLRFSTGMNWRQAVYSGGTCTITAYCLRGGFTAIVALLSKGQDFLYDANAYYLVTLFALPASLLFLAVLRRVLLRDDKLRQFLNNDSQLKLVIAYELAAVLNLVVIHSGRYLAPNSNWYMAIVLGACTLTLFMLIYSVYQSIHSTELLEYRWSTKALEEQYHRQLQHYKSYQKYTESYRVFRHDYKSMMTTLKALIKANDNEKAVQLLDDLYDDMQKKVSLHKKYSNNITLDAILQDLANICTEREIRFSSHVFVPINTRLTLLSAIRIFSNLSTNAVEACDKVPPEDRFIEITSGNDQQWITLEVINSYDGQILEEKGRFLTTKPNKLSHGLGLKIVRELVESIGGFVICDADSKNKTFLTRIHIPHIQDKAASSL